MCYGSSASHTWTRRPYIHNILTQTPQPQPQRIHLLALEAG